MNEINLTYEAIASNEFLSDDLKANFNELITVFHQLFNNVDLSNFNERIKRLRIKKGSKFFISSDCEYNPRENVLYINEDKLKKVDAKHSLMMSTLSILTAKDSFYGLNDNGSLEGLNKGLTELIANFLVGNEVDLDEE